MADGRDFDGYNLLNLLHGGHSPFHDTWDVKLLIQEIEDKLSAQVVDIPHVSSGSNNYGFHMKLSNGIDVVARLARGDVNMPGYDGFPIHVQVPEAQFEAESTLLGQAAHIRASLYNFQVPDAFASAWLHKRVFEQKPESFPIPVAPTRDFCVTLFTSKIQATIRNMGDMIGWESDNNKVGPVAAAAKQSLLRLIPHIIPAINDESILYRFVIDHGDFGVHNMSVAIDTNNQPLATSLYDWENGCIVPAILSDPLMAVTVDFVADGDALPAVTRLPRVMTVDDMEQMATWSRLYYNALFLHAPHFEHTIKMGKDARHLWFALRDWRGDNPEDYFGALGSWAEKRMGELSVDQ
ncbi:hypothetical protein E4U54_000445 [Claviceps lovelessii]|nr:hypothetical protein E4U54_000445 [Claviceps lovelessii]